MDYLRHLLEHPAVRYGAGIVVTLYVLKLCARKIIRKLLIPEGPSEYKQDIVYLHMFPRRCTKGVVNLSPYAIKLETWLRLNSIPYEVCMNFKIFYAYYFKSILDSEIKDLII